MGLSITNTQTVQFRKKRTAGLSQSNARKNNRPYKLANQRKVPLTTCQKNASLADDGLLANTFGFLLL